MSWPAPHAVDSSVLGPHGQVYWAELPVWVKIGKVADVANDAGLVPKANLRPARGLRSFDDVPIGCGNNPCDLPNVSSPAKYAEEGNISYLDGVRLEWFVPDRVMSRLPSERSARREAPPVRTG